MQIYLDLLKDILKNGIPSEDRTGTGTLSVFGRSLRFNMEDGFPLLTTKRVHMKSIIVELLWFLKGGTNVDYLNAHNVTIWDEWAGENGELGPVYGKQWRDWRNIYPSGKETHTDQIRELERNLVNDPNSRRHIVSAWNVGELPDMALPPCHMMFQCYVRNGKLSMQVYQRSVDVFLGLPFNIASYAMLLKILACRADLKAHELIMILGDTHLYNNHMDQVKIQLEREPRNLPKLVLKDEVLYYRDLSMLSPCDIDITDYDPHPVIKAPISI